MRRWLLCLALLACFGGAAMAQTGAPVEKNDDSLESQLDTVLDKQAAPIQVFYTKAFFQEPWRDGGTGALNRQILALLGADVLLLVIFQRTRRSA